MKTRKGFTLIELLVVIVIIGILATQLVPAVLDAPARARDVARTNSVNTVITGITSFNADYGHIPYGTACLDGVENMEIAADEDDDFTEENIKSIFGNKPPVPPRRQEYIDSMSDLSEDCYGYVYKSIKSMTNARENSAYMVATPVERFASANVDCGALDGIESLDDIPDCEDDEAEDCPDDENSETWCYINTGS